MSGKIAVNRKTIMESGSVHTLTKQVLDLSKGKDCVDAYYDVLLAAEVLKNEMENALNR